MGKINLARIDSRLAHGKMVEIYCDYYNIKNVIIANDRTYNDLIRIEVMKLTIPENIQAIFLKVEDVKEFLDKNPGEYFLLTENTTDLEKIIDSDVKIDMVNVGIIHLSIGKKLLTEMVAIDDNDKRIFEKIIGKSIPIFINHLPSEEKIELSLELLG